MSWWHLRRGRLVCEPCFVTFYPCTCEGPSVYVWWSRSDPHTCGDKNCTGMVPGHHGNSYAGHTWPRLGSRSHSGRNGWSGHPAWPLPPLRVSLVHLMSNDSSLPFPSPPCSSLQHLSSPPPLYLLSSSLSPVQPGVTPAFSSLHRLWTCVHSQHLYLFVLLQDPKERHFLMTRMRRKFGNEEEDSEVELEEGEEGSRERCSKAPYSFADDAVLESPLH